MVSELGIFILDKFFDPCKKCLVRPTCQPTLDTCPRYKKYHNRRYDIEGLTGDIEWWIIGTMLSVGLLFIITTFAFGIWKWSEIIF